METDRELLELAAKAAGLADAKWSRLDDGICFNFTQDEDGENYSFWNPLIDDADALRLAVKLRIHITMSEHGRVVCRSRERFLSMEPYGDNDSSACRRAITCAAAAIGRSGRSEAAQPVVSSGPNPPEQDRENHTRKRGETAP